MKITNIKAQQCGAQVTNDNVAELLVNSVGDDLADALLASKEFKEVLGRLHPTKTPQSSAVPPKPEVKPPKPVVPAPATNKSTNVYLAVIIIAMLVIVLLLVVI